MKVDVNYIGVNRDDAIGKVNMYLLKEIIPRVNFNLILFDNHASNILLGFFNHIKNLMNISKIIRKDKIIHFESPAILESLLIFFTNYKKSILTVHHVDDKRKYFNISQFFLKIKYSSFSKLIVVSKKTKEDLMNQYKINSSKIVVIYNGVDRNIFKPVNKEVDFLRGKKYILYLGSDVPRKNISNLLKAFKEVLKVYPNLFLVKAGKSDGDNYKENTKKLIKQLKLNKQVIFISRALKEEELPLYYSNAQLFAFPSLKEGFGMPLVEAMACGCPVVTSKIPPMSNIARGQVLINPYNYIELKEGIIKILSNIDYRKKLSEKAIIRSKYFNWKKSANKLLDVYKELDNIH